jgi:hypothetical protein
VTGRRGTTTTLNYVLTLGISAVLISGLVIAGGTVLEQQREEASRTGLRVAGQQLASDIASVDRLAAGGTDAEIRLVSSLPARTAGEAYRIEIEPHPTLTKVAVITLTSVTSDVVVEVRVRHRTPIQTPTSVGSGRLVLRYNETLPGIVIRDA